MRNKLHEMQKALKAPKSQNNDFGRYKFRSCEDILEAVKKVLPEGVTVSLSDEMVLVGDRYYVKATAMVSDEKDSLETTAFAREADNKKGMDLAQVTGAASSYARKYALSGLFAIDDNKDSDTNEHKKQEDAAADRHAKEQDDLYNKISMNMLEFEDGAEFKEWWVGTKKDRETLTLYQQKELIKSMNIQAKKFT